MNHYITGPTIKSLREKQGLTQAQLAEILCISDKTVSKWETGKGLPDITLLEPLAKALKVSLPELAVRGTDHQSEPFSQLIAVPAICLPHLRKHPPGHGTGCDFLLWRGPSRAGGRAGG